MSFEDATRYFSVTGVERAQRETTTILARITDVDAFAQLGNTGGITDTIDALLEVNLEENGGWVAVHRGDVLTDLQSGRSYSVSKTSQGAGFLMLTVSRGTAAATGLSEVLPPA